jgi:hypothetical protein
MIAEKDNEELRKLVMRRCLVLGQVRTIVTRFQLKKGEDDVWVVWDLSKNSLNLLTFTPSFFLPMASSYVWRSEPGMEAVNFDVGEQFHNYILQTSEQHFLEWIFLRIL